MTNFGRRPDAAVVAYTYRFVAWPDETWGHPRSLYTLFEALTGSVEMHFTETEFERFRSELGHAGFTLRECVRWPKSEREQVG